MMRAASAPGRSRLLSWLCVASWIVLLSALSARAQISPGKLSAAHEKLEGLTNCTSCHKLGEAVLNEKCLECHTAIGARIDQGAGYHASSEVSGKQCAACHSEHHGRDYDLVYWPEGRDQFDHALTGFELKGKHADQKCDACHKAAFIRKDRLNGDETVALDHTQLGLSTACTSCHVDEHRDQLTDDCLACHTMEGWTPASGFDHAKARYPLTGKHTDVSCEKCHPWKEAPPPSFEGMVQKKERVGRYEQFSGVEFASCASCHEDVHKGRFGQDCQRCHTTASFKTVESTAFNHDNTGFPLRGKHTNVECKQCHTTGVMTDPLKHDRCADCHTDQHRGQFAGREDGGACESCHTVQGWIPATYGLDQHAKSDYPLTGSHLAVPCNLCHVQIEAQGGETYARFTFDSTRCQVCHEDPHRGQLNLWIDKGGCEYCHSTDTWHKTSFDHSLAAFPLEGKHREVLCLKCHTIQTDSGGQVMWMKPLKKTCAGCHEDEHDGQFLRADQGETETECQRCHTPEGWKKLDFDHNRDSRFVLDGAHIKVACGECHKPEERPDGKTVVVYKPLGMECADCHGGNVPALKGAKG